MKKILKRIGVYLLLAIVLFVGLSVVNKLFIKKADWLWLSLIWAIVYTVTVSFKKSIFRNSEYMLSKIMSGVYIIVLVFFVAAFVTGVVLNMTTWFKYTCDITAPCLFALITGVAIEMK